MRRLGAFAARVGAVAAAWAPQAAWACSTCFDPKDVRQGNYLVPTLFMTFLPLSMMAAIGGYAWFAHRRAATTVAPAIPFPAGNPPAP